MVRPRAQAMTQVRITNDAFDTHLNEFFMTKTTSTQCRQTPTAHRVYEEKNTCVCYFVREKSHEQYSIWALFLCFDQ